MSKSFKTFSGIIFGVVTGVVLLPLSRVQTQNIAEAKPNSLAPAPIPNREPEPKIPLINIDTKQAIAKLEVGQDICTAFFVSPSKLLTADHCFKKGDKGVLTLQDGTKAQAQKEKTLAPDAALVSTDAVSKVFLERMKGTPGAAIQIKGWRLGVWTEGAGNLLDLDEMNNWDYKSNPINAQGWSGAPIIQDGKWIGINVGFRRDVNKNVAIPEDKIIFDK